MIVLRFLQLYHLGHGNVEVRASGRETGSWLILRKRHEVRDVLVVSCSLVALTYRAWAGLRLIVVVYCLLSWCLARTHLLLCFVPVVGRRAD